MTTKAIKWFESGSIHSNILNQNQVMHKLGKTLRAPEA